MRLVYAAYVLIVISITAVSLNPLYAIDVGPVGSPGSPPGGGGGGVTSVNGDAGPAVVLDVAEWVEFTVNSSDFTAVANSEDIPLATLAAGSVLHAVQIKHSTSFTGGGITAYTLSVGESGYLDKFTSGFNVFSAPSATNALDAISPNTGVTAIRVEAVSTDDTLNNAGAGTATIRLLVSNP